MCSLNYSYARNSAKKLKFVSRLESLVDSSLNEDSVKDGSFFLSLFLAIAGEMGDKVELVNKPKHWFLKSGQFFTQCFRCRPFRQKYIFYIFF